ncbi:PIN domain-containing protein [Pseudochelatococcus contaminans]|uniref:Putative nucleic acid-binding protein n=1 Tax=Pseudochelatococcus contaminans TaxID=1538103 RepID=A0A7W5Z5M4_9HYPH|nr:putative nucleic acid-binding protein [Pseudochelatococcus contaminans]
MIAFFDANALIYLIDGCEPFAGRVRSQLAALSQAHPDVGAAVSRLSWLECRVGPMKHNHAAALALFDAFFARPDLVWVELNRDVVELATVIRVRHGLRTPDALQAASCLQLGPDHVLLTGDAAFQRVQGLNVLLLA